MKERIKKFLEGLLKREDVNVKTEDGKFGHYSTSIAFTIGKEENREPKKAAEEIAETVKQNDSEGFFESVEPAGGGFVNFCLSWDFLKKNLNECLKNLNKWGEAEAGLKKQRRGIIMLEYFQPNVAKLPHIGHLRSAVIGDALKRILKMRGHKVVSDTHIGDWGTQFGILLYAFGKLSVEEKEELKNSSVKGLHELYVKESAYIEENPDAREEAKQEFAFLEEGDRERRKIWDWMVSESKKEFDAIIKKLGLLPFEEQKGESFYGGDLAGIVAEALGRGVAKKTADGAVTVDLTNEGLDEAVLIKADGASTYLLRDLATIKYRAKRWNFIKNLYVVDVRQALHFKQVFRVAEMLGIYGNRENRHIEFGFMSLPEGALSTRKGKVIFLDEVIDDVQERAREVIREKNPKLKKADKVACAVGLGALKYFDLLHNRKTNVIFDREKSLAFEGATAPYIQYTNARLLSILRKAKRSGRTKIKEGTCESKERELIFEALRLPEVLDESLRDFDPSVVAKYLLGISGRANEWYHAYPVLSESDKSKKLLRLGIARAVSASLSKGLCCLGIEAPEEM